jgi:anaerobic selenocysteine-containing dehydrogenase
VKVNNYVDKAYSPDRVLYPMRRTGPKGSGQFTRVSWDEALDEIAPVPVRDRRARPEAVMPVSYLGTEGILNGLNGRPVLQQAGATITERTYCDSGAHGLHHDDRRDRGRGSGEPGALPLHRHLACNMISTNLHLWPFVAEAQPPGARSW